VSHYTVTLNSDVVCPSRRHEAEAIVRSYFPYAAKLAFDYLPYPWPVTIMEFPKEAFGLLDEIGAESTGASSAAPRKHPGDLIQPHVEAELKEMLATRPPRKTRYSRAAA